MATLELKHYAHKVGVNVHHLEWCTKYRYKMFKQDNYKNLCEDILRETAQRHKMIIRELSIMPEYKYKCRVPAVYVAIKGNATFER